MTRTVTAAVLLVWLPWCSSCAAGPGPTTLTGRVVRVADGDTVTVVVANQQHRVRLLGIDCPEKGQPFGDRAKRFTSAWCFGKTATVIATRKDRYGRLLGDVRVTGKSLGPALVAAGLAWHYKRYSKEQTPCRARAGRTGRQAGLVG